MNPRCYDQRLTIDPVSQLGNKAFMAAKAMRERHGMACSKIRNAVAWPISAGHLQMSLENSQEDPGKTDGKTMGNHSKNGGLMGSYGDCPSGSD